MAPSYTSAQRAAIAQFVSFSHSKESVAARFLKTHGWNVEQAVDAFFQSPQAGATQPNSTATLNKIFDNYRDDSQDEPDVIQIEGAMKYLGDLNVELDEVACLAVCELLKSPTMGQFTREGYLSGWRSVPTNPDSIQKQASHADTVRTSLTQDPALFKRVYRYAFTISRPEGSRNLPMEVAVDIWKLFFTPDKGGMKWNTKDLHWLDWWLDFYTTTVRRPVNKDLWEQTGELVGKTMEKGRDLSWWSEDGSWPIAIDEFVEWVKQKIPSDGSTGGSAMEVE